MTIAARCAAALTFQQRSSVLSPSCLLLFRLSVILFCSFFVYFSFVLVLCFFLSFLLSFFLLLSFPVFLSLFLPFIRSFFLFSFAFFVCALLVLFHLIKLFFLSLCLFVPFSYPSESVFFFFFFFWGGEGGRRGEGVVFCSI